MLTRERPATAPAPVAVRRAARPLWVHALGYAVLLVALAPFLHLGTSFTSDEGAYALQVEALEQGTWEHEYVAERFDPDRRWTPLAKADVGIDGEIYPYTRHPAYPRLLQAATSIAGDEVGLYAWGIVGAVGLALVCALIAREVAPGTERAAFWVGAAGPVLVNATLLWAHALSAAVAGLAVYAAIRLVREPRSPRMVALLAVSLGGGALLRSEGLLLAVAVLAAVAGGLILRRRPVAGLLLGLAGGLPVVVATYLETRWQQVLLGAGSTQVTGRRSPDGFVVGRFKGAWHSVAQGAVDDPGAALLALLALVAVGAAALLLRRGRADAAVVVAALGLALYGLRYVLQPNEPITGLLTAWPILLLAIPFVRLRAAGGTVPFATMTGISVLYAGATFATQYAEGGGWEWGGRFFSPIAAPLAVVAAMGARRLWHEASDRRVRAVVVAVVVVPAALGVGVVASYRSGIEPFFAEIAATAGGSDVVVTTYDHLPRAMWQDRELPWMLVPAESLTEAADQLAAFGAAEVTVVAHRSTDAAVFEQAGFEVTDVTGPVTESFATTLLRLRR